MHDLGDDIQNIFDIKTLEVKGKSCPACMKFIERISGCDHVRCACGHEFCWNCLNPPNMHNSRYACNGSKEFEAKTDVLMDLSPTRVDSSRSRLYCECIKRRYQKLGQIKAKKSRIQNLIWEVYTSEEEKRNSQLAGLISKRIDVEVSAIFDKYQEIASAAEYSLVYYMFRRNRSAKKQLFARLAATVNFIATRVKYHIEFLSNKNYENIASVEPSLSSLKQLFHLHDNLVRNFNTFMR